MAAKRDDDALPLITMRGLPVLGAPAGDGLHEVDYFKDPIRRLTLQPARLLIKEGEIVAYGVAASSQWMWKREA